MLVFIPITSSFSTSTIPNLLSSNCQGAFPIHAVGSKHRVCLRAPDAECYRKLQFASSSTAAVMYCFLSKKKLIKILSHASCPVIQAFIKGAFIIRLDVRTIFLRRRSRETEPRCKMRTEHSGSASLAALFA